MISIVTIKDDPARVHRDQYERIGKLFEPEYVLRSTTSLLDQSTIDKFNGPGKGYTCFGVVCIAENNKDVTINGNPKLFFDIANEIEKLGYSVVIEY